MRNPIHLDFNRNCDLLLDFFRSPSRPLCNNLHPGVGYIGIGFDRQVMKCYEAPDKQDNGQAQNDKAVVQREIDQRINHRCSAVFWNSSAFATTC